MLLLPVNRNMIREKILLYLIIEPPAAAPLPGCDKIHEFIPGAHNLCRHFKFNTSSMKPRKAALVIVNKAP